MKDVTNKTEDYFLDSSSERMEASIRDLFQKGYSPKQIFETIKNHPDVNQVSRFLYNAGLDKTLLDFSIKRLKGGRPIAWPYVLKVLMKYKVIPKKDLAKIMFRHLLKHKKHQSSSLFACREWEDVFPKFEQLRSFYFQELKKKNLSGEDELKEQLAFVQAQNLIKEEEEIIIKLLIIDSRNPEYRRAKRALDEKKALMTIQEQKKQLGRPVHLKDYMPPLPEHPLKKEWLDMMFQTARQYPERAKNLSLFLYFCGRLDEALEMLEMHVDQVSDYWFYLDWALETKQYAKGLELINHFFMEVKEGSTFFLPLIYIKSQMLYALGKKSEALEYLTAISQVQPDYKSVQYFLEKWSKEV